jgi:quinoprotein glucose dehydrogenase
LTNVPPTGSPSQSGLLVTKNFLFAGEGSGGMAVFHAYDKKTGQEVWQGQLPGPQTGVPMSYAVNGKQYVVIAARGPQGSGAQLVAWTIAPPAPAGGQGGRGRGNRGQQ